MCNASCVETAVQFAEESWGTLIRRNVSEFSSVFPFLGTAEVQDSSGFKSNHSDLGNVTCITLCMSLGLLYKCYRTSA